MDISKINKAAEILYNSKINVKRIRKLPEECTPQSFKEAYDIQEELVNKYLKVDKNNSIIGKKIGCTNKAAQAQLNINESFFGNMFSKNISKFPIKGLLTASKSIFKIFFISSELFFIKKESLLKKKLIFMVTR